MAGYNINNLPIAKLIRTKGDGQTNGILYFGVQQINTIERPWMDNAHDISCIPEGDYICKWGFMSSHNVHHYELQEVPDRTSIFIHKGTKVEDSKGCIISDPISIGCLETWLVDHAPFVLRIRS